jgi:hypothetical protein
VALGAAPGEEKPRRPAGVAAGQRHAPRPRRWVAGGGLGHDRLAHGAGAGPLTARRARGGMGGRAWGAPGPDASDGGRVPVPCSASPHQVCVTPNGPPQRAHAPRSCPAGSVARDRGPHGAGSPLSQGEARAMCRPSAGARPVRSPVRSAWPPSQGVAGAGSVPGVREGRWPWRSVGVCAHRWGHQGGPAREWAACRSQAGSQAGRASGWHRRARGKAPYPIGP